MSAFAHVRRSLGEVTFVAKRSSPAQHASELDDFPASLTKLARVPRPWIGGMILTAALTSVHFDRAANGDISGGLDVGTPALIALALVWLPMLLKVFALVGGSLKAGGLEANLPGFLSQSDAIGLGTAGRRIQDAHEETEREAAAIDLNEWIARVTLPVLAPTDRLPDSILSNLARNYERIRREMSPGPARTSAMTKLVSEVTFRASTAPDEAKLRAPSLLASPAEGDRIVGLALVQETGDAAALSAVLHLIEASSTAFEMFHALLALQEMSAALGPDEKQRALSILEREKHDPRSVGVVNDSGLMNLIPRTAAILRGNK